MSNCPFMLRYPKHLTVLNTYLVKIRFTIVFQCLLALWVALLPAILQADNISFNIEARRTVAKLPEVTGASPIDLSEIENKPVIVTFFASWCPPCLEEFSHLNQLHKKYSDSDLKIIAINVHEAWDANDAERMDKFISTTSPAFPAVVGSEKIRELFGGIDRIPTVYGFNRKGELIYRFIHQRKSTKTNAPFGELEEAAIKLLAAG